MSRKVRRLEMRTREVTAVRVSRMVRWIALITSVAVFVAVTPLARAENMPPQPPAADDAVKIPADQLDALVAPIALYPDNLLSQTLVASTYPLELIQLQQWLDKNQNIAKDQNK